MLYVVTVNYNNLQGLRKTVESYKRLGDLEVCFFIIDGNSTDGSAEFIKEIDNEAVSYLIENDKGTYYAMNKGIHLAYKAMDHSQQNYLIFMNSGDEFHSLKKSTLKKCHLFPMVAGRNLTDSHWVDIRRPIRYLYWGILPFCHQSLIYNCNIIDEESIKFSTSSWSYNDYRQVVMLSHKYRPAIYIDDIVSVYEQVTSTGLSRSSIQYRIEKLKIVWTLFGFLGIFRIIMAKIFFNDFEVR